MQETSLPGNSRHGTSPRDTTTSETSPSETSLSDARCDPEGGDATPGGSGPGPTLPASAAGDADPIRAAPIRPAPIRPNWSSTPALGASDWHRRFGGREWRYDAGGVYLRDDGGQAPERTPGEPVTAAAICDAFGPVLVAVSNRWQVPPELLVTIVATEAGAYRTVGFTGPLTFRWEPGAKVRDVEPSYRGDYSFGPMQTLAGTAREISCWAELELDAFETFPALRQQPNLAPPSLPGYRPEISLAIGAAYVARARGRTGDDPILVSANYNAGGLYDASNPRSRLHNAWHLRSYGNHLDRAARWFGDACAVVGALRASSRDDE